MSHNVIAQPLNVMTLPLHGERLIEASAGTGKTYTIAGLYLRLLLGHGDGNAHPRALSVDEILVVTFTEAATAELRDRIRARIVDTRYAFIAGRSDDPLISELLTQVNDHKQAEQLLLNAVRQMDEAAIYTIHGFCQRMLKEHAFESGSYFDTEFVTDESTIRLQAVEDFWRHEFYHTAEPLDFQLAKLVRSYWSSPQELLKHISRYLSDPFLQFQAPFSELTLKQAMTNLLASIDEFKQQWSVVSHEIVGNIQVSGVDKRSYSGKNLPKWFEQVNGWVEDANSGLSIPEALVRFDSGVLSEKTKKGAIPDLAIFDVVHEFLANPLSLKASILAKAIDHVRTQVTAHKTQQSLLSFDDLLKGLNSSLANEGEGSLARKVRAQYPLAMIDEFQDTDLMQYQIFSTIYAKQSSAGLLMIGDPKQAIYSFRGADIFTYIKARQEVSAHYTLDTNYRSTPNMVNAVNTLFEQHPAPFIYENDIGFNGVKSVPKASTFTMDNQQQGALTQWLLDSDTTVGSGDYQTAMALACANQINLLLTKGQQGHAGFVKDEVLTPVKASDIAILVRTGNEAQLVKSQLAKQGIASVYLSNRQSIFSSNVVSDCARLLHAIASPNDARAIKSAMATKLMAQDITQLERLNNDEKRWQQLVDQFNHYQQRWQQVGVLAMLRELMHHQQLPSQLLAHSDGQRQLTDLMHLGEILQQQSLEVVGEHALVHWLNDQINNEQQEVQEQQLRLESDQNLVQIVTIHKAKGLEYNLVFMPFVCSVRKASHAIYHQDNQTLVDLTQGETALAAADKERLAEDLRLFYVGVTRAVHHLWLGFAPLKSGRASKEGKTDLHQSAVGYLYLGAEVSTSEQLTNKLNEMATNHQAIISCPPPLEEFAPYQAQQPSQTALQATVFNGTIENNYWITSYSALTKHNHHSSEQSIDAPTETTAIDWDLALVQLDEVADDTEVQNGFSFPRGADAGTFLHTLFEEIDFSESQSEESKAKINELLSESEFDDSWLTTIYQLVDDVLYCPLSYGDLPTDFALSQLHMQDKLVEMEFFMPINSLDCQALNQCLAKHDALSKSAHPLSFSKIKGMLKGFIDLIFVADGKYYVLDYKSNHLGDSHHDYNMNAMSKMMIEHRYDFQYQLYTLALHRLLATRIKDYDFDTHVGGVFYLFVRGMDKDANNGHGIFYNRPSKSFIHELDTLFSGQLQEQEA